MGKKYFVCANSGLGFVNYFDDILKDMEKIYIIKGGPGSGKSTMMKSIGKQYEEKGFDVDYIYCSSDPNSLDGIIINDYNIAIVDGTAPHVIEPKTVGAVEEYVSFTSAWNIDKLKENKDAIKELQLQISNCYEEAYSKLRKAKSLHDKLEKHYILASDFKVINEIQKKVSESIEKTIKAEGTKITS